MVDQIYTQSDRRTELERKTGASFSRVEAVEDISNGSELVMIDGDLYATEDPLQIDQRSDIEQYSDSRYLGNVQKDERDPVGPKVGEPELRQRLAEDETLQQSAEVLDPKAREFSIVVREENY